MCQDGWKKHDMAQGHECARLEELHRVNTMGSVASMDSMCKKEALQNAATEPGWN